jgi:hypothetical protein
MLAELRDYGRIAAGIARMQREPLCSDPEKFVRDRLLNRQNAFLDVVQRVIFSQPHHPYYQMFQLAGCEFGDLAGQIRRGGLEGTLSRLRQEGVYLSHNEWKGKVPIVRSGREIPGGAGRFTNPLVYGWLENSSSGSTGAPVLSARSSAALADGRLYQMLRAREFATARCAWIDVKPILPAPYGLNSALRGRRAGTPIERWFSAESAFRDHAHYRILTRALVMLGNVFGAAAPYPIYLPRNDFSPVAEYIARRRAEGRDCMVHGFASPLVRIAGVALEKGYDISGTVFFCGGEALSPAKRRVFESAGARAFSSYTISEIGNIGAACRNMTGSCVHLFEDSVAVIGVRRPAAYPGDGELNSLHFTTLVPHAPNVFINVEMDDSGVIETASCDCVYSRLGLTHRIDRITSFGKATPQGTTFHCTDLAEVMEQILPARLGGGPGDFQLVECEAANGQTQVRLHVSPRCGLTDSARIRRVFLEIMRPLWGGAVATREWIHSGGVEVVIAEPLATRTGKVHPVRLLNAYRAGPEREHSEASHAS